MASCSPTDLEGLTKAEASVPQGDYLEGWKNISRQMDSGSSWSGRERNCAYLNLGNREFVNVSAVAGLDDIQDGRALADFDWDGDGDLDLWLKSRNGRQLRLLENKQPVSGEFLSLRLRGVSCNRDAIGARVEVTAHGKTYVQELRCGEGYLSQSSAELIFGLRNAQAVQKVVVFWPGEEKETFEGLALGGRYRLVQGAGTALALAPRAVAANSVEELADLPSSARVVLRTPLPLPTSLQRKFFDGAKPVARLINLWATWCEPCIVELGELAQHGDELAAIGLQILPMRLDPSGDDEVAGGLFERLIVPQMGSAAPFASHSLNEQELAFFETLYAYLIAKKGPMPVPLSLLVDKHGLVEVLYVGPLDVNALTEDVLTYGLQPETVGMRSAFPGRWFYGMPRNFLQLSSALRGRGLGTHASFYTALHKMTRKRSQ